MATKILTAKAVEKMKGGLARREVPDGVVPGLYLIVQPSGRKSWAVRGRLHGKPLKYTLNAFELAKARTEAKAAIGMIREGKDPRTEAGRLPLPNWRSSTSSAGRSLGSGPGRAIGT